MLRSKSLMANTMRVFGLLLLAVVISSCAASRKVKYDSIEAVHAETELPEVALLDVGIVIFDPGVDENHEPGKDFVFPDVRRAEARYMPYHLKKTLEATGHWGSIWVLPERSEAVNLLISGRVDHSDGLEVELRIGAWDSTGREWINKTYKTRIPEK